MAIYCIDDGGDGSQTNTTQSASTLDWSKADVSIADLISYDSAAFTTSGNIIYFGDDHNDPDKAANWTLTGPSSNAPVILISADRTQSTPTYKAGTGNQISSLGGAYTLTNDGAFACYGIKLSSGSTIVFSPDGNETQLYDSCTLAPGANAVISWSGANVSKVFIRNVVVDLSADGTTTRTSEVFSSSNSFPLGEGWAFVNAGYRTGTVVGQNSVCNISGADFSGFNNATLCEIVNAVSRYGVIGTFTNCLTAATWAPTTGPSGLYPNVTGMFTNCGPADSPTYLYYLDGFGAALSTSSIYRTGGATIEGDAFSLLITTTSLCFEGAPFYTPWAYGTVSSTGSKTFDLYITNDTADFTDAQVWLEVESLSTADEAIWAVKTDQRATITATAAAQTDDTTSTWNGTGPSFTYKQKLSVSATVNETGQYRARVAVGVASIAGSRYFYVDPKVTVS